MSRTRNISGRNLHLAILAPSFCSRFGNHMSVVIATALLSPAFFSCQKEASPQGTEPTPVQIYILRAKKTTLQGLDLFFFHDDALALLDSYQHIDAPAQERVQGIAGSGAHHLVAFSNVPASRFQWSDIRSVPALSSVSFSLEDDSPAAPFLFGECPLEEGRSRRCTLRLTPALCKIELRSLSCDFRGKAYEGLPFHLIFIVHNKKAQIKCPFCGSIRTARILYDLPVLNEQFQKRLDEGKVSLGGCCIMSVPVNGEAIQTDPTRVCND